MLPEILILKFIAVISLVNSAHDEQTQSYLTWSSGVPIRRIIEYEFNVSWFAGAPNGVTRQILGVNGQYPGPTLRGTRGDLLRVRVTNQIQTRLNVSIHWHGQHMRGATLQDGVEQVSQCPLVFGESQVYEFQLVQTGTHWWHSHYGPYLADGLWGVLIVDNEPEVWGHLYTQEITIALSDWFQETGEELTNWYLGPTNTAGKVPFPSSFLINGQGYYPCADAERQKLKCVQKPRAPIVFEVVQGTSYRIRVVDASSALSIRFSIDNHTMECIEVDGVDTILGGPVDLVTLSVGMRYSLVVKMDVEGATVGSEFTIRATGTPFFDRLRSTPNETNINMFYGSQPGQANAYAILRYVSANKTSFLQNKIVSPINRGSDRNIQTAVVELVEKVHCLPKSQDLSPDHFDEEVVVRFDGFNSSSGKFWTTNGVRYKLVDGEIPTLFKVIRNQTLPPYMNALYTSGNGSIVQLVINNRHVEGHPVHLHGHSFWIVGVGEEGEGDYTPSRHAHRLRTRVPKRDTTRFLARSWLVLRYVANNPGVWLLHCHVNWHVPGGMAAVIVEGQDILRAQYNEVPMEAREICVKAGMMEPEHKRANADVQSAVSIITLAIAAVSSLLL